MQFVWTIIIAVLMWLLLNRHRFGAHVYLVGDNQESARLMGVERRPRAYHVFRDGRPAGGFRRPGAEPGAARTSGRPWGRAVAPCCSTLASVFVGGTSVFGGVGTIFGTFVGAFIIGSINAGVVAMNISGFWTQLVYGMIIVLSVGLQTVLSRRLR